MVHLHVHTHFSFGIGVSSPEALAQAAAARGHRTLACTDTNGVYGAVEFQRACEAEGVRPILGAHLVAGEEETVALAADERGWAALCRAITAIHWSGDPPCRLSDAVAADRDGLVLLSRDVAFLERVAAASGTRDLYAELVPGKERHAVLAAARRLGIPAVATNAAVMAHPEDWSRHRLLRAIHLNTTLRRTGGPSAPIRLSSRDAWLRPAADLERHFPDCPEAVRATDAIAERCRYRIPDGRIVAPRLAEPDESLRRLRALAYEGAARRYGTVAPVTRARLESELAIIAQKGFADYFLVVHDIVVHGPTHCGRGSVANSIVSYCLGITHVEPLGAGLLFERFLNPERKDPPDIDLDFPWDERDQVLAYVFETYPRPQAAMVANHNCFRLRGALREVAKVHGRPAGEIREVTRRIPWYEEEPLEQLLATHPNFRALDLPPSWRELARAAAPLVGLPRHLSVHPGGVVIVPTALTDYVPIEPAAKTLALTDGEGRPRVAPAVPVIQFEKDGAEDAGLVKIDLLGNRSLAVIRDAIAAVHGNTGRLIDYTSSDAGDDEATRALFRTGQTMGVFYTESPASRALCAKSRAETFELLVLNTSIIRPASNRYIRIYLERLHGAPYEPLDPVLRDTLAETFGVMVYQEDVVNVCAVFAGMPLATADGLRKSLSKKRPAKQLAGYAEEFFAGAVARAREPETIERVWEMIMSFAGYSFCKGHSASYIQVAQHSCYLRAHYPGGVHGRGARQRGRVLPSVRLRGRGDADGHHGASARRERERHPLRRERPRAPDRAPVREGAHRGRGGAGGGGPRRGALPLALRPARPDRNRARRPARAHQGRRTRLHRRRVDAADDALADRHGLTAGRWSRCGGDCRRERVAADWFDAMPPAVPVLKQYSAERRRREEYAALGFVTDTHPMRLHADAARALLALPQHRAAPPRRPARAMAGMLTTAKPVHTLRDEPMEFATFDDGEGLVETVLFPRVYRERGHVLFDQGPFMFRGKVEEEFGAITVTVTHLDRLERVARAGPPDAD